MDDADRAALHAIQNYIDENYPDVPDKSVEDIMTYSYSKWALYEIQERITENASSIPYRITGVHPLSPLEITEQFIQEMGYYWRHTDNVRYQIMFVVAKQAAESLLEILV